MEKNNEGATGEENKGGNDTRVQQRSSSQTFGGIGLLEAVDGNIVLRGRHGERDHLYPLDKAIRRFHETERMISAMARTGMRGWDTLMDINKDMKGKILDAVKQRRSLNMDIPQDALDFEQICSAFG